MQDLTRKEIEELRKYEEVIKDHPDKAESRDSYQNMFFRSVRDGENQFFGQDISSVKDRRTAVILHKNKQYLWLLAEAWEEFEDYLEDMYACAGYMDNDFWPLRDYGSATLSELKMKPFEWFQTQAKLKKERPGSIINKFRSRLPSLRSLENSGQLGIDLKLALVLLEKIRHVVVHLGGQVGNREEFIKSVIKGAGVSLNGKSYESDLAFINLFFRSNDKQNTIFLLEVPTGPEVLLKSHINVFETSAGYLVAYAHILCDELNSRDAARKT